MASSSGSQMLDLYKLAVEMADRVSARRATANAFFVTIQSAIATALGFLAARRPAPDNGLFITLSAVGVLAAAVWFLLLRSYRDLNRAKFEVILMIESELPVKLFSQEWASLKKDPIKKWGGRYAELGSIERLAPAVFAALNILTGIYLITS
jgi:hypothetical protein